MMEIDTEKEVSSESCASEQKFDIMDVTGGDGLWQRRIFVFALLLHVVASFHMFSTVFLAPNLDHWCARPPEVKNLTVKQWRSLAMPPEDQLCSRYEDINFTVPLLNRTISSSNDTIRCESWEYDNTIYSSTVLSQFDLVCDRKWMVSLTKSVFFFGATPGSFVLGHVSDWIGRKPVIIISGFITVCAGIISAFSTSFTMFLILRFFISIGAGTNSSTPFVLMMEIVSPEYRNIYGIAVGFGASLGIIILPLLAWLIGDSFWIQMALNAYSLIFLAAFWMPESPRWLLNRGKTEEAKSLIMKAAKINGANISVEDRAMLNGILTEKSKKSKSGGENVNVFDLLKRPGLRKITFIFCSIWFMTSFVYQGISLNTNELAGNPFVNFALCGIFEIPAYSFVIFTIEKLGKRNLTRWSMFITGIACFVSYLLPFMTSFVYQGISLNTNELAGNPFVNFALCGIFEIPAYSFVIFTIEKLGKRNLTGWSMFITGIACFVSYLLPSEPWWLTVVVIMMGKFSITISSGILFIYGSELFPTVARNIGIGSAQLYGRIASITAPFMRELGDATHPIFPQIIFGVFSVFSGLLIFLLPDTSKCNMPDTLEEAEHFFKIKQYKKKRLNRL